MQSEVPKKTKRNRDESLFERRLRMMGYLSEVREVHYATLMEEFKIPSSSVVTDLNSLERDFGVPLVRKRGKSVKVEEGWYASRPHFKTFENLILLEIWKLVPEKYQIEIEKLIRSYGNPALLRKPDDPQE